MSNNITEAPTQGAHHNYKLDGEALDVDPGVPMTVKPTAGLYDPSFERDSCGFGLIANLDDRASHFVVETAISALARLTHRGAVAADGKTGDGCGLLIKFPEKFLRAVGSDEGFDLAERFAVGTVFLSQNDDIAGKVKNEIDAAVADSDLEVAGWRVVPVKPEVCGALALKSLPRIEQVFVNAPAGMQRGTFNRQLFMARRRAEKHFATIDPTAYVTSLSSATIIYKGMVMPDVLPNFYTDLRDPRLESSVCVFHQRFSTNTLPSGGSRSRSGSSPTMARSIQFRGIETGLSHAVTIFAQISYAIFRTSTP